MIQRFSLRPIQLYLFVFILLGSAQNSLAGGQSVTVPGLQVVSAEYVPGQTGDLLRDPDMPHTNVGQSVDMILVRLVNTGQKVATAYSLDVKVTSAGNVVTSFGHSLDMLNPVLNGRCTTGPGDSWEGAIKPGDIYTDSMPPNVDRAKITDPAKVVIHVAVTGVLWSDGSVDAESDGGRAAMRIRQERREEDARDEAKIVAILDAHQGDPDIRHRISEVTKAVDFLVSIRPNVQEAPPGSIMNEPRISRSSRTFFGATQNLRNLSLSPHPAEQFEAWSSIFVCRYKQRVALQQPESLSKPKQ
jgi:hypothetical protein